MRSDRCWAAEHEHKPILRWDAPGQPEQSARESPKYMAQRKDVMKAAHENTACQRLVAILHWNPRAQRFLIFGFDLGQVLQQGGEQWVSRRREWIGDGDP